MEETYLRGFHLCPAMWTLCQRQILLEEKACILFLIHYGRKSPLICLSILLVREAIFPDHQSNLKRAIEASRGALLLRCAELAERLMEDVT